MVSKLNITAGYKRGGSFLKDCYFTRPFRVANISEDPLDLNLMIMSSSPGLLDGDRHEISMEVESHARLVLQSQGYQRLYRMKTGASQHQQVQVQANASFQYIPHPVVPHTDSIFDSENRFDLEDQSELIYGEVLTCGRKHSGEIFCYKTYRNKTDIHHQGKLIYRDQLILEPSKQDPAAIGHFQGFTHSASFVYAFTGEKDWTGLKEKLLMIVDSEDRIRGGLTRGGPHLLAGRFLGMGGESLWMLLKKLESCIRYEFKNGITG